jgi:hypothetical protein
MKKSLLLGLAALLVFAIGFSGCENPTNTLEKTIEAASVKLADPVVSVKAYEGFNVVSWSPVPDAANYDIWRLDTESKTQINVFNNVSPTADLSYVDNVTDTGNSLVNGRSYQYTVIAKPAGINATGTTPLSARDNIYSGKGSASVTANVPNRLSYKVPKATNIQTAITNGQLYVSFTVPDNATAKVTYTYADAALGDALLGSAADIGTSFTTTTGAGYLYPAGYTTATFPVIGGTAKIKVQTEYFSNTVSSIPYFFNDDLATADVAVDKYAIGLEWGSGTFTALYLPDTGSSVNLTSGTVRLTFPGIANAADYGAVTYKVYKAEVGTSYSSSPSIIAADYATAQWTLVTFSDPLDIDPVTGVVIANETVTAWTENTTKYLVIAEVQNSGKTVQSLPKSATLTSAILTAPILSVNLFDAENKKVALTWTAEEGVTYTLSRAVINEATTAQEISAYENIDIPAQLLADTQRVVIDTLPKFRQSYRYRLIAEKDGLKKEGTAASSSSLDITAEPFSKTVTGTFAATTSTTNRQAIDLTLTLTDTTTNEINSDLRAAIYRSAWVYDSSPEAYTPWAQVATGLTFNDPANPETLKYEDANRPLGTKYKYRVVLTTTETGLTYELTGITPSTDVAYPATAYSTITAQASSPSLAVSSDNTTAGTLTILTKSTIDPYPILTGAKLYLANASDTYEELGTIAYTTTATAQTATVAAITAKSYYVSLNAAALAKVRKVGGSNLYLITEKTDDDQKPTVTTKTVSITVPTVYSLLNTTITANYATNPASQGVIQWTAATFNADNTALISGVTVYYQDNGEYKALGDVAANTTAVTQTATVAAIAASTYYVRLNASANTALHGSGSTTLYLRNYNYTSDDATNAYQSIGTVSF